MFGGGDAVRVWACCCVRLSHPAAHPPLPTHTPHTPPPLHFTVVACRCWVVLELYAGGNIILLDHDFVILSLLRTHSYDESVRVAVKQVRVHASERACLCRPEGRWLLHPSVMACLR